MMSRSSKHVVQKLVGVWAFSFFTLFILADSTLAKAQVHCAGISSLPLVHPSPQVFHTVRNEFLRQAQSLHQKLLAQGTSYYQSWDDYLKLSAVLSTFTEPNQAHYEAVKVFKRWLFSNQKGLETPFFTPIRTQVVAYERVLFTHNQKPLHLIFESQKNNLFHACQNYNLSPSNASLTELQKYFAWFEKTGTDGGQVRRLFASLLGESIVIRIPEKYIREQIDPSALKVLDTQPTHTTMQLPLGFRGRNKTVTAQGQAVSEGQVHMQLVPSSHSIRYALHFSGFTTNESNSSMKKVHSTTHLQASLSAQGILDVTPEKATLGALSTSAHIHQLSSQVSTSHRRPLIGRMVGKIAKRRLQSEPVQAQMHVQSQAQIQAQLESNFRSQIESGFKGNMQEQIESEFSGQFGGFEELGLPLVREGVQLSAPALASDYQHVYASFHLDERGQFGADRTCVSPPLEDAITVCVHQSFISNLFEKLWAGKWVRDDYFEQAGKLMFAESPYELYTHDRKERWEVLFADQGPLSFDWVSSNQLDVYLRVDGFRYQAPGLKTVEVIRYPVLYHATFRIEEDDLQSPFLRRTDFVASARTSARLPEKKEHEAFIERMKPRMGAFLGHVIDMGGINVPEGGKISKALNQIQIQDWKIQDGWMSFHVTDFESFLPKPGTFKVTP